MSSALGTKAAASIEAAAMSVSAEAASWAAGVSPLEVLAPVAAAEAVPRQDAAAQAAVRRRDAAAVSPPPQFGVPGAVLQRRL